MHWGAPLWNEPGRPFKRLGNLPDIGMSGRKRNPILLLNPTEAILESISDGVFTVDMNWRVTSFNRAAEEITGVARREAIGRLRLDVFRCSMCGSGCALDKTIRTGRPIIGKSAFIIDSKGSRIPISVSTAVLRDAEGRVIGGAEISVTFPKLRRCAGNSRAERELAI